MTEAARVPAPKPGTITIARHGKPALSRDVRLDWRGFRDWWGQYDEGGLEPGQQPPKALLAAAAEADVIFSSSLRRAVETAAAVAGGRDVITDPIFVEAPLPPPRTPGKYSPRTWGVYARLNWWMGAVDETESRDAAELRAEAAAATLAARALRGERVLLLAHGWFNRMLRPVLVRQGWRCVHDGGDNYWAHRRYERR